MRCVHCGKEVRDNTIFCINCDRPVKSEYNKYACEIYDSVSILDKIAAPFRYLENFKDKASENIKGISGKTLNVNELKDVVKGQIDTVKLTYENYIAENKEFSESRRNKEIAKDQETVSKRIAEETGESDSEWGMFGDSCSTQKHIVHTDPTEKKKSKIKIIISIAFIALILIPMVGSCSNDEVVSYVPEHVYVEPGDYEFPIEPAVVDIFSEDIDSCFYGNRELITEYLMMIYSNTEQLHLNEELIYTAEDLEPYIKEIEQIQNDYPNNESYGVYSELIYINYMWKEMILNIKEYPEQDNIVERDQIVDDFFLELKNVCKYYLIDNF